MRFAFYREGKAKRKTNNNDFHVKLDNLEFKDNHFYKSYDNNVSQTVNTFFNISREILETEELPFYLLTENELQNRTSGLDFNKRMRELTRDKETIYINVPKDVDFIFTFYESDFLENEIELEKIINRSKYPPFSYSKLVPLEVENNVTTLKLMNSTKKKSVSDRYFLFIANFSKTIKSIFNKYNPRLYEIFDENNEYSIPIDQRQKFNDENVALIVHGFMSRTEDNFIELKKALRQSKKYNKIYGYSYSPNKVSIEENGEQLTEVLTITNLLYSNIKLDIFAHSEGGLVVRSMIVNQLSKIANHTLRNFITAGTPHNGTPFAKFGHRILTFPRMAIIVAGLMMNPNPSTIYILRDLLSYYVRFNEDLGLRDMIPNSVFLNSLNEMPFNIKGAVLLAGYHTGESDKWFKTIVSNIFDKIIFKNCLHDLVVPFESSRHMFLKGNITLLKDNKGWHSDYFSKAENAMSLVKEAISL
ncbi:esterase/lipase family protein [Mesobacillus maritimus]|uniref:DUF7379 domain-containing protein n=1 Tax=Mesobacillus maritimus TaxID=1643336 RepID=A0ABS7K9J0_9BACI|nr:hypothetical protein [Mesobacillus maritimus]MBY0098775.1 hypothetical protein [Mesobacillus maritimus]